MAYIQIPAFPKINTLDNDTKFVIVVDGVEHLVTFKTLSDKFGNTPELLAQIKSEIEALRNIVDALPTENPAAPIALKISDTPIIDGIYKPTEAGTYPNAGGLIYNPTEGVTYFIRTNGVWVKDVTPINFTPIGLVEEGNTDAVSGGEVFNSIKKVFSDAIGFNKFPKDFPYKENSYVDYLTGNIYDNNDFNVFKIPVEDLVEYTIRYSHMMAFFNTNDVYLGGFYDFLDETVTLSFPEGTTYILLSVLKTFTNSQMVVKGRYDLDSYIAPLYGNIDMRIDASQIIPSYKNDVTTNWQEVRNNLSDFTEKWANLTDNDMPLEVQLIGDSITNFQNCTEWKTNKTVEPQGLYGNSYARWLWRRLNYTFNENGVDSKSNPFNITDSNEWGKMRFFRVDNTEVIKSGEFIPHGTRVSDNNKIYWGQREYIGTSSSALGGFRGTLDDSETITTSVGDVKTHNHVYFFADGLNEYCEFELSSLAKGFSIVFWGDTPTQAFPKINGGDWEYLSNNVEVTVNGNIIGTIDQTAHRGQTRVNFSLNGIDLSSGCIIRVTNKATGKTMNLWGLEYWYGKAVRAVNYALAGNPASSFYENPDFFINKPADLILWQTTTLNNTGGESQVFQHLPLGELLILRDKPVLVITTHPVSEDVPTITNYVSKETSVKIFQHKDAWAVNKALSILNIPYVDVFGYFLSEGYFYKFTGVYNNNFIDLTHLSSEGTEKYSMLLNKIFNFN